MELEQYDFDKAIKLSFINHIFNAAVEEERINMIIRKAFDVAINVKRSGGFLRFKSAKQKCSNLFRKV